MLRFGGNEVDFRAFRARSWNGAAQELTEKEAMILKVLAERPGEIVSREDLLERVWGYDVFPSTRTVDNFILRLRKRFERDPANPRHFLTVWGVGYRFLVEGGSERMRRCCASARAPPRSRCGRRTTLAAAITRQSDAPPIELVHIRTEGDERTDVPLWSVGGKAFFTKEIDRALLAREIDVAVHSLKDLATQLEPGTALAAVLAREDPRDALLAARCKLLRDLPPGARVGTSSLRRRAFLAHARPDLAPLELRGNVPTRVERLQTGDYDAIILAGAGLCGLGLAGHITCHLPVEEFPPAVSQGAIGVCVRADDERTRGVGGGA